MSIAREAPTSIPIICPIPIIPIMCGDVIDVIDRKRKGKFLGLIIDDNLNWHSHIAHVKSKITSSLFAIYIVLKNN